MGCLTAGMDHDRPAGKLGVGCRILRLTILVVENDLSRGAVPEFDPESVSATAPVLLTVDGRQQEAVIPGIVDYSCPFILRPRSRNYQSFVGRGVEIEVPRLELELGLATGNAGSFLVF